MITTSKSLSRFIPEIILLLTGALTVLAFAPLHYYPLAILTPAVLLFFWQRSSARRAAWLGFVFGFGFFGAGVYWVYISVWIFGGSPLIIALLITLIFVSALSAAPALTGYVLKRWFHDHPTTLLLAFPTLWVLCEWVRGWLLTGFPWLHLGDSQVLSPLGGWAPIFSVYGVSFVCALAAGFLVNALSGWRQSAYSLLGLAILFGAGYGFQQVHWTEYTGQSLNVTLVQGNIPQNIKWQPSQVPMTLQRYKEQTQAHWQSDLIVWPEAAVPLPKDRAGYFLQPMAMAAKQHDTTIITGIPIVHRDTGKYYNGMIAMGKSDGQYLKRHLVPFGEYVPLERVLRGLIAFFDLPMSNFSAGPAQQHLFLVNGILIAPFICYEVAYLPQVLGHLPDANLLLNVSNDSWFGDSWASDQQLQIAQMRSLETGRYQAVAGNSGITAIIDDKGRIVKRVEKDTLTSLTGRVYAFAGHTPITWLGATPIIILLLLVLLIAFIYRPEAVRGERG